MLTCLAQKVLRGGAATEVLIVKTSFTDCYQHILYTFG